MKNDTDNKTEHRRSVWTHERDSLPQSTVQLKALVNMVMNIRVHESREFFW